MISNYLLFLLSMLLSIEDAVAAVVGLMRATGQRCLTLTPRRHALDNQTRFKAATGSSMIEYLQNHRIEEAKRHLEEGKLSVEDVSLAVGYEDLSFFRRLFKRLTGLTPGEYRRLFRPLIEESAAPAGV